MYYIVDLFSGKETSFETERDLARAWFLKFGLNFDQLNVTGRDTRAAYVTECREFVTTVHPGHAHGEWRAVTRREFWTRPLMILDGDGRSVDVRTWPREWFESPAPETARRRAQGWTHPGTKTVHAHKRGPTLQLAAIRAAEDDEYLDEVDVRPVRDRSRLRRKAVLPVAEFGDREGSTGPGPRSWKDQSRARRQYARHKRDGGRNPAPRASDPLAARASQYDVPDYAAAYLAARPA